MRTSESKCFKRRFFCSSEMARRYFLTYFTLTSFLVAGQSPEYALQGGEVSLKPGVTGNPDGILWKHNGNKVVEFNGKEQHVYKPFENRITVDWVSADIQITDLRFEDSGEYELELELNKKLQRFLYQLDVIDKIAKPTISCEINDDSIGNISGKLLCSAKPGRLQSVKKLEWRSQGSVQPGPEFNIPLGGEHNEEEYSCTVSNPLSSETATFTAKDCYPVKSSSVGVTAGLVSLFCILLLGVLLGIVLYCKLRHKACFAKDDPEKQSPKKGEEKNEAESSEKELLLHPSQSTLPSNQPLHFNQDHNIDQEDDTPRKGMVKERRKRFETSDSGYNDGPQMGKKIPQGKLTDSEEAEPNPAEKNIVSPPSPRHNETASSLDLNNRGDEDADQNREDLEREIPQGKLTDSEKAGPDPADLSEGLKKNTEEHEKTASPPSPTHSGSASSLDQSNVEDEDADQHREPADDKIPQCDPSDSEKADPESADVSDVPSEESQSDMESSVTENTEPEKKDDEAEEMQSAPASAENCSPAQPPEDSTFGHKEDANSQVTKETKEKNVRESDSSGEEERNESDDSAEDEHSPTPPEHKGLETTRHEQDLKAAEEETHISQDNKREVSETVKPVSEDGNKTESVGDCKETDKEPDLYLATSQHSQSPTPSSTFQETPDTAGAEPDQEEEEQQGHDKSKVQSEKDKGDVVEDKHEVECGREEEKPGNESLSEDEEEQKKNKVVA
ncbi:ABC transporter F family member 4 isoform X2 [Notothenia coriiceps]|uniref:ABC transporter F family member 4 isoform X2 n=1 Tax=Notothenia coriiceps TaxID=8208 RepID=A0A6I9PRM9_9TELE|nr:PREDICTED: ABC transporter F family member 4-like isoform X2 [Notothenia coriiceps]